ncbi:MAG: hypothetical protein AAF492_08290, partial [Verrucomicrobiota bacterium]
KSRLRQFMFWMVETACYSMIKRVSMAVGHSQLSETYKDIREDSKTNSFSLVDISIRLDNLGFPEAELKELNKTFSKNLFCQRLLKQLTVQHFYLFPTKESTKQKVCDLLGIKMEGLRQIDFRSKKVRKISGRT